jgi:hypothetical protein
VQAGHVENIAGFIVGFIVHAFVALVMSVVIWILVVPNLPEPILQVVEGVPLLASPLTWGPGFILGFLVNRLTRNRSACRVWSVGTVWLGYGIWDECRIYRFPPWFPPRGDFVHRAWHIFFTSNDAKSWGGSPLVLVIFTIPALGSIAYSIGAWIALRAERKSG